MPRYDGGNLNFRLGGGLGRMKYIIVFIAICAGLSLIGGYLGRTDKDFGNVIDE